MIEDAADMVTGEQHWQLMVKHAALRAAAEQVAARVRLMPVQLTDERGLILGMSTYACVEVPVMDRLIEALGEKR